MIPDAFRRRGPEPGFKIFRISFRLPLSTNQKAAITMVTQVPPNAAILNQTKCSLTNKIFDEQMCTPAKHMSLTVSIKFIHEKILVFTPL